MTADGPKGDMDDQEIAALQTGLSYFVDSRSLL
jgi:hypothetical protein